MANTEKYEFTAANIEAPAGPADAVLAQGGPGPRSRQPWRRQAGLQQPRAAPHGKRAPG